jgi:uncharacterized repeat protein (TIGR04076 family)
VKLLRTKREALEMASKVIMEVISAKGVCEAGHEAGETFDLGGDIQLSYTNKKGAICPALFYAIYPNLRVLRFGGSLPWEEDKDVAHVACPDPFNPVVVRLRRVRQEKPQES